MYRTTRGSRYPRWPSASRRAHEVYRGGGNRWCVDVVISWKPQRRRIGALAGDASTCSSGDPRSADSRARTAIMARYRPRPRHCATVVPPSRATKGVPGEKTDQAEQTIRSPATAASSDLAGSRRQAGGQVGLDP